MIRITVQGGGTFLTEGPIEIHYDAGWPGTDVTGPDPPEFSIKAPPHDIQIWERDVQITIMDEAMVKTDPKRCEMHGAGHKFMAVDGEYICDCGEVSKGHWPCPGCGGSVDRKGARHDICIY